LIEDHWLNKDSPALKDPALRAARIHKIATERKSIFSNYPQLADLGQKGTQFCALAIKLNGDKALARAQTPQLIKMGSDLAKAMSVFLEQIYKIDPDKKLFNSCFETPGQNDGTKISPANPGSQVSGTQNKANAPEPASPPRQNSGAGAKAGLAVPR